MSLFHTLLSIPFAFAPLISSFADVGTPSTDPIAYQLTDRSVDNDFATVTTQTTNRYFLTYSVPTAPLLYDSALAGLISPTSDTVFRIRLDLSSATQSRVSFIYYPYGLNGSLVSSTVYSPSYSASDVVRQPFTLAYDGNTLQGYINFGHIRANQDLSSFSSLHVSYSLASYDYFPVPIMGYTRTTGVLSVSFNFAEPDTFVGFDIPIYYYGNSFDSTFYTFSQMDDALGTSSDQYQSGFDNGVYSVDARDYWLDYLQQVLTDPFPPSTEPPSIAWFRAWQNEAYNRGHNDGVSSSSDYSFFNFFTSLIDSQFSVVSGLLNFNFLGFNLWDFVRSLVSIFVVVTIITVIVKRLL